jgi:hypothetical protein
MKYFLICIGLFLAGCREQAPSPRIEESLNQYGSVEITARLLEIPQGAIVQRELYDYTTILKYEVVASHRGSLTPGNQIYIGHYNPLKPRSKAADKRVKILGGNLSAFKAGDIHRLALEPNLEENYLGGIINLYPDQPAESIYWAIWTNQVAR